VPSDTGGLGTAIYLFILESPQPVGEINTSGKQLLWKPHDPNKEGPPFTYLTLKFRDPWVKAQFIKQLLRKPRNSRRQGTPICLVTFENSRHVGARNTSCTQLLRKPCDPGR
jgi:hypothetical protein